MSEHERVHVLPLMGLKHLKRWLRLLSLTLCWQQVSHFVLRLAHCQTEDQRRWFLAQECALFKHRLAALSGEEVAAFTKVSASREGLGAEWCWGF